MNMSLPLKSLRFEAVRFPGGLNVIVAASLRNGVTTVTWSVCPGCPVFGESTMAARAVTALASARAAIAKERSRHRTEDIASSFQGFAHPRFSKRRS